MESFEVELLLQSMCAIVKSDRKVHQKELENIEIILNRFHNELRYCKINAEELVSQFQREINLNYKIATDHFNAIVDLLNQNKTYTHHFLILVLKIVRNLAVAVNQMNKSELIMLSRLESIFKNYLS